MDREKDSRVGEAKCLYYKCKTSEYDNQTRAKLGITIHFVPLHHEKRREFLERMNIAELGVQVPSYHKIMICSMHFPKSAFDTQKPCFLLDDALPFHWRHIFSNKEIQESETRTNFKQGGDIYAYIHHLRNNKPASTFKVAAPQYLLRQSTDRGDMQREEDSIVIIGSDSVFEEETRKESICRLCGKEADGMVGIFSEDGINRNLPYIINRMHIKVSPTDKLPLQVCGACIDEVISTDLLFNTLQEVDKFLKKMFNVENQNPVFTKNHEKSVQTEELDLDSASGFDAPIDYDVDSSDNDLEPEDPVIEVDAEADEKAFQLALEQTAADLKFEAQYTPLTCFRCFQEFANAQKFNSHCLKRHGHVSYHCQLCNVFFGGLSQLREHNHELHADIIQQEKDAEKARVIRKKRAALLALKERIEKTKPKPTCKYCNIEFSDNNLLRAHMVKENQKHKDMRIAQLPLTLKCACCNEMFPTITMRNEHTYRAHKDYKPFECDLCSSKYRTKQLLQRHIETAHFSTPELCSECGKVFSSKHLLRAHMAYHKDPIPCKICSKMIHPNNMSNHVLLHLNVEERKTVQCTKCNAKFNNKCLLRQHMQTHSDTRYCCFLCKFSLKRTQLIYDHIRRAHSVQNGDTYKCIIDDCNQVFPSVVSFFTHMREDHKCADIIKTDTDKHVDLFFCRYCKALFSRPINYKKHIEKEHAEETSPIFNCSICMEEYPLLDELIDHVETHPESMNLKCRECPMKFADPLKRTQHEKTEHIGKRKKCPICGQSYSLPHYQAHVNSHTNSNVKTYKCDDCDQILMDRKTYDSHRRTHIRHQSESQGQRKRNVIFGEYKCEHCNEVFSTRLRLHWHRKIHFASKLYYCKNKNCNYVCTKQETLAKHRYKYCKMKNQQETANKTEEIVAEVQEEEMPEAVVIDSQPQESYSVLFYM